MPSRKRAKRKIKFRPTRGSVMMVAAALWLGYRALTAPEQLQRLNALPFDTARLEKEGVQPPPGGWREFKKQVNALQAKIDEEHAVLEDLGNPDGISRLPAGHTNSVAFHRLTPHCPALKNLESDTWIEIDEMGQILSLETQDRGKRPSLPNCQFEPYRDLAGRPVSVRTLYQVGK